LRSFVLGLALLVVVSVTVLSLRPGGIRKQMHHAARRLKLALVLGGFYVVAATIARIFFPDTWIETWAPPAVALALAAVFVVLGQDQTAQQSPPPTRP
jgi:peptidoglycan/LPS O-acetylase OafA/YrhL